MGDYTPAPWKVAGKATINADRPEGGWIASVSTFNRDANAKLIASAPRIADTAREAAVWLRGALDCPEWVWDGDQREAAEDAYAYLIAALEDGGAA